MLSLKIPFLSTVLVKVDYNISSDNAAYRIEATKKTIFELISEGHKVVLITHYGRPQAKEQSLSTKNLVPVIEKSLGIKVVYINQFKSFEVATQQIKKSHNQLFILENTRYDLDEVSEVVEKKYNLAKKYSQIGSFFVDEGFSVSHRNEATNTYIKKFLPFAFGYRYKLEIENLNKLKDPKKPFFIVMGGAKVETKLPLIKAIIKKADKIIIGGMICFTFLEEQRRIGKKIPPLFDTPFNESLIQEVKQLFLKYPDKIILPVDLVYKSVGGKVIAADIGSLSSEIFCNTLKNAKTIFWNGALGEVEQQSFDYSTMQLKKALVANQKAFILCGGGDTEAILSEDDKSRLDFVSTGGGACLDYLTRL
jgi:phosphoglycerate kinase